MEHGPGPIWRAAAAMLVLWGAEIALARISGEPQPWIDILASAALFLYLGLLVGFCVHAARKRNARTVLLLGPWFLGALMPFAIVVDLLEPVQQDLGGVAHEALGVAAWVVPWALAAFIAWRRRSTLPSPWVCGALVPAAALVAWALEGWPEPGVVVGVAVVPLALAAVASWLQPRWLAGVVLLGLPLGLARWPGASLEPGWTASGEAAGGPDILLITVDTLRADAATAMDSYRRLASEGTAYERAQASSPWTLPSMASVFTGLETRSHGALRQPSGAFTRLGVDQATLATALEGAGYDTAAVVGSSPYLSAEFGFDRGFAVFEHARQRRLHALPRGDYRGSGARLAIGRDFAGHGLLPADTRGDAHELVDRALAILEQRRDRPLFLWVHFMDPHLPYTHAQDLELDMELAGDLASLERRKALTWEQAFPRDLLRAAYDNEVAHVDRALQRLLDTWLDEPGRVTVLTADHGEEFDEHGGFEHGHAFWQELLAVPLVVAGLDVQAGGAGLVDLAPTLALSAGATLPEAQGSDLRQARDAATYCAANLMHGPEMGTGLAALHGGTAVVALDGEEPVLFDLDQDPFQHRPTALSAGEPGQTLLARCRGTAKEGTPADLDPATRDQMRALGYLDGE